MRFDELNEDNYMMFAIKHYENPQAVTQEDFYEDLKKFKYIKRLLKRYQKSGELKSHLLLNHFICLYNVFDDAATPLLFFKIDRRNKTQRNYPKEYVQMYRDLEKGNRLKSVMT